MPNSTSVSNRNPSGGKGMFIEKQPGAGGRTIHRQDPAHIRFLQTRIDTICHSHDVLYQRSRLITRKDFGGSFVSHQVTFGMVTRRSIAIQTFAASAHAEGNISEERDRSIIGLVGDSCCRRPEEEGSRRIRSGARSPCVRSLGREVPPCENPPGGTRPFPSGRPHPGR